jgi:hypothetical protein
MVGCKKRRAIIQVSQLGACNFWKVGSAQRTAGPNAAFVVFSFDNIDNGRNSEPFVFEPSSAFVETNGRPHFEPNGYLARLLIHAEPAASSSVPAHGSVGFGRATAFALVQTANANGAAEANNTTYKLGYDAGATGTIVEYSYAGAHSWPYTNDCSSIRY